MDEKDIIDISKVNWEAVWQKSIKKSFKKEKNWDDIAKDYGKWLEHDDYPDVLIGKMKLSKDDTVLDVGCAEGTISRKIAKKVKSLTGLDKSKLMLEELNKKAKIDNLNNINTIQMNIEDMDPEILGNYDIVLASRCLNGISEIKECLLKLNQIANKYVYITVFGSSTHKYKKEKAEIAGKEFKAGTDYIILVLLLKSLGIEANVIQLDCKNLKEYHSFDEAIERSIWRLGELEEENRKNLINYFKESFVQNERGNWVNPKDKTDLVLIWWKKENI
ncbi:class I SAM-dependent methyltransferase [uncultured Methanobrevibacter sp.]|uniref:class I SAM-dependent methyltransferase n=1 Tax=uncultured Methanobrevibacter sp. TaxID=253161 RepID=UPI00260CB492